MPVDDIRLRDDDIMQYMSTGVYSSSIQRITDQLYNKLVRLRCRNYELTVLGKAIYVCKDQH